MSLFAELKRRNVFRMGVACLVTAWLLLQVADIVLDNALDRTVSAGVLPRFDLEGLNSVFEPLQGDPRYQAILQRIREHRNAGRAALGWNR